MWRRASSWPGRTPRATGAASTSRARSRLCSPTCTPSGPPWRPPLSSWQPVSPAPTRTPPSSWSPSCRAPGAAGAARVARPHVAEVHDLHVGAITPGMPAASAHVLVEPRQDCHAVRADLEALLARDYGITHLTLQVDHCPDSTPLSTPP